MYVIIVAGTRPNFVKVAPLIRAIDAHNIEHPERKIEYKLIHTGQHYDYQMSQVFFEDFKLPKPDIHLEVGSGTHAEQTGKIMIELEKILFQEKPNLIVVIGDVNSTLAAALAAVKIPTPIAHIEAGLRLNNFSFPEEVNRRLTDVISTYLFTPTQSAVQNLKKEGISKSRIFFVGNILADSICSQLEVASQRTILSDFGIKKKSFAILTLHRPQNVDNYEILFRIIKTLKIISNRIPIIYPIHPRAKKNLSAIGLESEFSNIDINHPITAQTGFYITEPLGYLDFLQMMSNAKFVVTDSGGLQAETTILNVPCLTLMKDNIWPETINKGTNILVGTKKELILNESFNILDGKQKLAVQLDLWDGKTAERIVKILDAHISK